MTDTSVNGRSPYRSVPASIYGVHAVFGESVGNRVGSRADLASTVAQARQPATLSTNPELIVASCDGIDHVLVQTIIGDDSAFSLFKPLQSALERGKPHSPGGVGKNRSTAFFLRRSKRIRDERGFMQPLEALRTSYP